MTETRQRLEFFLEDLNRLAPFAETLPSAITIFGGSRLDVDADPLCATVERLATALVELRTSPRVGGRGGVMSLFVDTFLSARQRLVVDRETWQPTQAIDLKCWYDATCPQLERYLDLNVMPLRKISLVLQTRAFLVFPGGLGTMDEFFEVWVRALGSSSAGFPRIILVDTSFWKPILESLSDLWRSSTSSSSFETSESLEKLLNVIHLQDDPVEITQQLSNSISQFENISSSSSSSSTTTTTTMDQYISQSWCQNIQTDLEAAYLQLMNDPPAVTFIGGQHLNEGARSVQIAVEAAKRITAQEHGVVRVSDCPSIMASFSRHEIPFTIVSHRRDFDLPNAMAGFKTIFSEESLVRNEVLTTHCKALVALPGDVFTMNTIFGLFDQCQLGLISTKLILLDRAFWAPLMESLKLSMFNRKLSNSERFKTIHVIDSIDELFFVFSQ